MKKELPNTDHGFKTPEDYFDGFDEKLLQRLYETESLDTERTGFQVPEDYFDKLDSIILERMDNQSTKVIPLHKNKKLWAAAGIAAMLALIFGLFQFNSGGSVDLDSIEISSLEDYLIDNGDMDDTYELRQELDSEQLSLNALNTFNTETLESYLQDNLDDYDLYNQ